MKKKYFNVLLEFDSEKVDATIQGAIENNNKGYVCSVESNNLTVANQNDVFLNVLNNALVNICDGSMLAKILGKIHKKPFESYIGADLFLKYVEMRTYKQFFLGNTQEVLDGLKNNLSKVFSNRSYKPYSLRLIPISLARDLMTTLCSLLPVKYIKAAAKCSGFTIRRSTCRPSLVRTELLVSPFPRTSVTRSCVVNTSNKLGIISSSAAIKISMSPIVSLALRSDPAISIF